jgi:hypothetical protein
MELGCGTSSENLTIESLIMEIIIMVMEPGTLAKISLLFITIQGLLDHSGHTRGPRT